MITKILKGVFQDKSNSNNYMNGMACLLIFCENVQHRTKHTMYVTEGKEHGDFPSMQCDKYIEGRELNLSEHGVEIIYDSTAKVSPIVDEQPKEDINPNTLGAIVAAVNNMNLKSINVEFK